MLLPPADPELHPGIKYTHASEANTMSTKWGHQKLWWIFSYMFKSVLLPDKFGFQNWGETTFWGFWGFGN